MEIHAHVPKIGKSATHWLLEGVFIVVSVALGFYMAGLRESRANHELVARVLEGLRAEVEYNSKTLEPMIAFHDRWLAALSRHASVDSEGRARVSSAGRESARDVFFATWPDLDPDNVKPPFAPLRRGAWDAALSTGALRLVDYDLVAALSEIYQWQQGLGDAITKMPYTSPAFFDPAARTPSLSQLMFQLGAIEKTEHFLLDAYRRHLPAIRAAANAAR